ncbi:MAG: FAD-binding oxidoreductase [Propionibacteriaceae bacterium]
MIDSARVWRELSNSMAGPLLFPGDDQFESLRMPAMSRYASPRPQAIARCAGPTDVSQAIMFARRLGLETAVRGAGHSFADHSSTPGLLLETGLMNTVTVDGDLATIGSGARLAEIYRVLHDHRVTIPAGCGPTVGIAGLTLGGGLGVLGRTYGLSCDRLTSAEIVLADGTMITCDASMDHDLYWALRGAGGGSFGVVTALTFRTVPEPRAVAFHLSWHGDSAVEVVNAWLGWAPTAADAMAASLTVRAAADLSVPVTAHLVGAMIADDETAADVLTDFEQLASAPVGQRQEFPAAPISEVKTRLAEVGANMAAGPATAVDHSASEFYREPLPSAVASAVVKAVTTNRSPGQARELAFTPMGGAYNQMSADATAFVHRDELFLLERTASSDPGEPAATRAAAAQWLSQVRDVLAGYGTGRAYQNFSDPELTDPLPAYYGTNLRRLREVKARYDPDDFFQHGQSIPPTRAGIARDDRTIEGKPS